MSTKTLVIILGAVMGWETVVLYYLLPITFLDLYTAATEYTMTLPAVLLFGALIGGVSGAIIIGLPLGELVDFVNKRSAQKAERFYLAFSLSNL